MATLTQFRDGLAGLKLRIDKPVFQIGRGPDNDISIDDELVSKVHATIEAVKLEETGEVEYYLHDQESTNGSFVNDKQVSLYKLSNEDIIRIGTNSFRFVDDSGEDMNETAQLYSTWIPGVYYTGQKKKGSKKKGSKKKATNKKSTRKN